VVVEEGGSGAGHRQLGTDRRPAAAAAAALGSAGEKSGAIGRGKQTDRVAAEVGGFFARA
jgi:hypothetical protein